MQTENLSHVSTGEPTYWPSDRRKVPDLIDFGVVKHIPANSIQAQSSFDLSSDHSPVIINLHSRIVLQTTSPTLSTKMTNWEIFRQHIRENLTLAVPLTDARDSEDYVHQFVQLTQQAAWNSTPHPHIPPTANTCPQTIKQKILDKRKLRKRWQTTRSPQDKANLNKAIRELKELLNGHKQQAIQTYLEGLTTTDASDYSLWKATKRLQRPQTQIPPLRTAGGDWAKSDTQKANVLAEYFANVVRPYAFETSKDEEREILQALDTPSWLKTPIKKIKINEVRFAINKLRTTKAQVMTLLQDGY